MPALQRPTVKRYVDLPPVKAIDAGNCDVLVVGSGPAGLAAAWAAAREGSRVVLAEREGFLGGDPVASLVSILMSSYSQHPKEPPSGDISLFPADYGDGIQAVEGFHSLLVDRLVKAGGAIKPSAYTGFTLTVDPEIFKLTALDLMEESGVNLLLYAAANGVLGGGNVKGVVFDTKSGPIVVNAKVVVDCTGDGDICAMAGAPFVLGREHDGLTQPVTLFFIMDGFERERFAGYVQAHPDQWKDVYGLWDLIKQAEQAGDLEMPRENMLMFATPEKDKVLIDSTRVLKINGTDVWDLSRAAVENFRQMRSIARFLTKYVPGFEHARIDKSGVSLYVRESRRIMGDYVLTADDVLSGRKFDDVVAMGAYCIDLHNPAGKGTFVRHLPADVVYDIPLRCLLPQHTENLLVADRAISGTHVALASYRILAIGSATGQAAGVCAALAVKQGKTPRQVDVKDVQSALLRQKAILHTPAPVPA